MIQSKRIIIFLLLVIGILNFQGSVPLCFAQDDVSSELSEFLCDIGIKFYNRGQYSQALQEFQTVLSIDPGNKTAKKYVELIQTQQGSKSISQSFESKPDEKPQKTLSDLTEDKQVKAEQSAIEPSAAQRLFPEAEKEKTMDQLLTEMQEESKKRPYALEQDESALFKKIVSKQETVLQKPGIPTVLVLEEQNIKELKLPLEIEQTQSITIRGQNISRYLSTEPDILYIEKINPNEISVTGKSLGYTYLHVWDDRQRWTLEFLTIPMRPAGLTLEEEMREREEKAKNFKLLYSIDWSTFETGRRAYSLRKISTTWSQSFALAGPVEIPYGDLDFGLTVGSSKDTVDLTSISIGLENGRIGPFKDFGLRLLDYNPNFSNLAFSSRSLRGALLRSPAFDNKIKYTVFWGREGGTRYLGLTPQISKPRKSYVSGLNVNLYPKDKQKYNFMVYHGWGEQRLKDLPSYGYDIGADYKFDKWDLGNELGYDSRRFAYRLRTNYRQPRLNLATEFRNTSKEFKANTGIGSRAGEIGILNNLNYILLENVNYSGRLDVFKDRLFPRENNPDILNEDFSSAINWQINNLTGLNLTYSLQNYLGKLSPYRYHNAGIGLSRTFEWIRRFNTHANYNYVVNKNFVTPSSDYISNRVMAGFNFDLIENLNYFFDQEYSWIDALNVSESGRPHAYQTGLNWRDQILKSAFYGTVRFTYRNEENTLSPFSFMAGEDYIEGYGEIAYRPKPDWEAYFNTRVRNVWADNPKVNKRVDVSVYSGLRYTWDTGLRWDAVGIVEGYIFKDLNSDGLRQRDEAPMQGIKVWLGKDKFQVTDMFGYYSFNKVRARKVTVSIDTTTIPAGFVLTVPANQEVTIVQWQKVQANFGLVSRTEITGILFLDSDETGEFSSGDKGIKDVVLTLEDGTKAATDDYGRYVFSNVTPGRHKIILDLASLPTVYIPSVSIYRDIDLVEGASYNFNIPVRKTSD